MQVKLDELAQTVVELQMKIKDHNYQKERFVNERRILKSDLQIEKQKNKLLMQCIQEPRSKLLANLRKFK